MAKRKVSRMPRVLDGVVLAMIIALFGTCVSYYNRTKAEFATAVGKNQAAVDKLAGLSSDVERLERDVQRLKTDSRAVEELARHKLGLVRRGDVVINLAPSESDLQGQPPRLGQPTASATAAIPQLGISWADKAIKPIN